LRGVDEGGSQRGCFAADFFRREYDGKTSRESLGLLRPENRFFS
jgi:hypothetical protein